MLKEHQQLDKETQLKIMLPLEMFLSYYKSEYTGVKQQQEEILDQLQSQTLPTDEKCWRVR